MGILSPLIQATAQLTGVWDDGALATNPSASQVLADTGQLEAGDYLFSFMVHSTVDSTMVLVHRNAADSADISSKEVPLSAGTFVEPVFGTKIALAANERIVVRMKGAITGDAQASIFSSKIVG